MGGSVGEGKMSAIDERGIVLVALVLVTANDPNAESVARLGDCTATRDGCHGYAWVCAFG